MSDKCENGKEKQGWFLRIDMRDHHHAVAVVVEEVRRRGRGGTNQIALLAQVQLAEEVLSLMDLPET